MQSTSTPAATTNRTSARILSAPTPSTTERLTEILSAESVDLPTLKKVSWSGLPAHMRPVVWRLLLGYLPARASRRVETLARRRREYHDAVATHYPSNGPAASDTDTTMRQIAVDIPRTVPEQRVFHGPAVQAALTRILYLWAVRHPASGYVQGMNDLVTPLFFVFLSEHIPEGMTHAELLASENLDGVIGPDALAEVEADAYWALTALLANIQDYYTFAQPGIQRRVRYLSELISRVDAPLKKHLEDEGLDFLQFAFRWMNCLLMRELPFPLIIRFWDTYLSEPEGFALFHVFVCAALLVRFSDQLMSMEFQELVMFLQRLPTAEWGKEEVDLVLSQAYIWRSIFGAAPSHLQSRS